MLETAPLDAVYIAVPHYLHPEVAIAAFAKGLHVITEKPEAVYTEAARRMNEAYDAAAVRSFGMQSCTISVRIHTINGFAKFLHPAGWAFCVG